MHHIRHVMEQSTCMFTKDGKPSVDFIASVETLGEDFKIIASEINKRRSAGVPPIHPLLPRKNEHRAKDGSDEGTRYSIELYKACGICMDYIKEQYKEDFELLKYPRELA